MTPKFYLRANSSYSEIEAWKAQQAGKTALEALLFFTLLVSSYTVYWLGYTIASQVVLGLSLFNFLRMIYHARLWKLGPPILLPDSEADEHRIILDSARLRFPSYRFLRILCKSCGKSSDIGAPKTMNVVNLPCPRCQRSLVVPFFAL